MATRMQQRRGTASQWSGANPILNPGEIGWESDTNKFKIGDGVNHWADLDYFTTDSAAAVTAEVQAAISDLIGGAPAVLDTLKELADAINDDPAFFTSVATNLSNHESDTTSVHGITDTAELATKSFAASLLTGATKSNITITGDKNGLTITAENGVTDSTTDNLTEGSTNKYFTDERAQDAIGLNVGTGLTYTDSTGEIKVTPNTYDAYGAASTVAGNLSTHTSATTNVHGISDTSALATKTYADGKASDAQSAAATDATTKANNAKSGAETTAANALASHEADTTNIHGIADTSALATKTYADNAASTAVAAVVNSAPEALNTLKELADALTADESTAATLATLVGTKAPSANPTFTGTVAGITKSMVGLSNVDNTSDANKPVSTATQTALDAKAPIASPTFTGTVSGITKAMVGLGSVDNTADTAKPISTATQTALDAKFNSADASTTNITEGTNKYFTDERAQDAIASAIAAGTHSNITITYDDANNKFTFAAENGVADSTTTDLAEGNNKYFTEERAQDAVGNSVGTGLSYDDPSGSISVNTTVIQTRVENVSDTEIGYLDGVTSAIQTQLNAKLNSADMIDGGGV